MSGLLVTLLDLLLLNLMITGMLKMQLEHSMAGQFVVFELVLKCHLVCHAVGMTEAVVMTEVAVVVEVGVVAGVMTTMIEEEEVVATVVAVTGHDLEVQEEVADIPEAGVGLQDEDAIEALDGVEVGHPTIEETEVYHLGGHPALVVMIKAGVKVAVGHALLNITEEEGASIPMAVIIRKNFLKTETSFSTVLLVITA